jgi:hypothetical protein
VAVNILTGPAGAVASGERPDDVRWLGLHATPDREGPAAGLHVGSDVKAKARHKPGLRVLGDVSARETGQTEAVDRYGAAWQLWPAWASTSSTSSKRVTAPSGGPE